MLGSGRLWALPFLTAWLDVHLPLHLWIHLCENSWLAIIVTHQRCRYVVNKVKGKLDELGRERMQLNAEKAHLQKEKEDLQQQVEELARSVEKLNRDKVMLERELEAEEEQVTRFDPDAGIWMSSCCLRTAEEGSALAC